MVKLFFFNLIKTCFISVLVSLFFLSYPFFDLGPIFTGDIRCKNLYWIFWKNIYKKNHYSRSFLDHENWLCILTQFEKFVQMWGIVKAGLVNLKKGFENSICFAFHLSIWKIQEKYEKWKTFKIKFKMKKKNNNNKKWISTEPLVVKGKIVHLPEPATGTSFRNFLSVITLHYHRLS